MNDLNKILIQELEHRLIESGIHRIKICLGKLSEDQIHYRPNYNSNSINNQIIHLDGNVRQWLITTFAKKKDTRERDFEFDPENKKVKAELTVILDNLECDIRSIYPMIKEADLSKIRKVQCYEESQLSIVIHVIEHFSYHLGQITYITKMLLDIDTEYYAGADLNRVNE